MSKKDIVTERADLILDLGAHGYRAAELQRMTLVRLRLLALQVEMPGLFVRPVTLAEVLA